MLILSLLANLSSEDQGPRCSKGTGCNLGFKSTPTPSSLIAGKGLVPTAGVRVPRQRGHREGLRTAGTLCAHQRWYFGGEWNALGKSNVSYDRFEQILTPVYMNIPKRK